MLINCYLPCRGLKQSETDFTNTTDDVTEIVLKYKQSSEIVLVGDLNASLHRESPYARDKYLKDFMLETNLTLPTDCPDTYTYIHGKGQFGMNLVTNVCVLLNDHINTSPHRVVSARFLDIHRLLVNDSTKYQSDSRNVNWNKLDKEKYRSLIEDRHPDNINFNLRCDNLNWLLKI